MPTGPTPHPSTSTKCLRPSEATVFWQLDPPQRRRVPGPSRWTYNRTPFPEPLIRHLRHGDQSMHDEIEKARETLTGFIRAMNAWECNSFRREKLTRKGQIEHSELVRQAECELDEIFSTYCTQKPARGIQFQRPPEYDPQERHGEDSPGIEGRLLMNPATERARWAWGLGMSTSILALALGNFHSHSPNLGKSVILIRKCIRNFVSDAQPMFFRPVEAPPKKANS